MKFRKICRTFILFLVSAGSAVAQEQPIPVPTVQLPYDIVYVRQPRFGDHQNTTWPEVAHPARIDPGADLMLLHPDGSEELLVAGGVGAVTDPVRLVRRPVGLLHAIPRRAARRPTTASAACRTPAPTSSASICTPRHRAAHLRRVHAQHRRRPLRRDPTQSTRRHTRYDRLGYGILNLGPLPAAGRQHRLHQQPQRLRAAHGLTNPTLQLFVMDEDGGNVTQIAPMNIGSALHPTPLRDGRLLFS